MTENSVDLLEGIETRLIQASSGKRFANYIIDLIVFYIIFLGLAAAFFYINPSAMDSFQSEDIGTNILDRLLTMLMYGIIMGVIEGLTKGRSLGKLITGTRAVNEDGTAISAATAFKRGLSRAVPFNTFSALGSPTYPWHDKWTKTYVINLKESILPEEQEYSVT